MKTYKLVAVLILLPLLINLFGVWESHRSLDTRQELAGFQADLQDLRVALESMGSDAGTQSTMIELGGDRMSVAMAMSRLVTAEDDVATLIPLNVGMTWLARAVIALGLLAALVGGTGLLALRWAGTRALHSRERLLQTFTRVSRILPFVLVGHIIAVGAAVASILTYEGLGLWHAGRMSAGEFKLMFLVLMIGAGCLYSIWKMAKQLRVMLHMFEPTALQVLGRQVSEEQAPTLWAEVRELADRLGALPPDHIVIGVTEGFYVTSSDVDLMPAAQALKGRILHVPLVALGLLDTAEINAVIGHELAHFAGADTEYSLKFLPIYDGIGRSLGVIAATMLNSDLLQRTILRPAFMLGAYFMESFDHAVNHWSRVRELAADAAGAKSSSNLAIASALVRLSATDPLVQEHVHTQIGIATNPTPERLPTADLPASVLQALAAQPLTLPTAEMDIQMPHPSDTHPSNGERVSALHVSAEEAIRCGTRSVDAVQACIAMDRYFADPLAIRAHITADYLQHHVAQDVAVTEELRARASAVSGNVTLHEGARLRGLITLCVLTPLLLVGLGLLTFGWLFPDLVGKHRVLTLISGGVLAGFGVCFLPFALRLYLRASQAALVLSPDHLIFSNLNSPLPIQHIADFGLQPGAGLWLNLLLEEDAPLPVEISRSFFKPDAKVDKKRRLVRLQMMQFCRDGKKLKPEQLAELVANYLNAGFARHALEQRSRWPDSDEHAEGFKTAGV